MAQLKDSVVSGNLRVTDTTLTDTLQVTTIKAPTSAGGTTYGTGTSGQVLKSYGATVYWADDSNNTYTAGDHLSLSGNAFSVAATAKTITDWNSATTTGWYMGSSVTNAPSTAWWIGRVTAHNTNYVIQEAWQFTKSSDVRAVPHYKRMKTYGIWGSWYDLTVGKAVPTDAVFTDTTYSSGTGLSLSGTTFNHKDAITEQTTTVFKKFKYNSTGHITGVDDVTASDLPAHTHSDYVLKAGDTMTGSLSLYTASGDSPAIIFKRGTFVDSSLDWKIYDTGGTLTFSQAGRNTSAETWVPVVLHKTTTTTVSTIRSMLSVLGQTYGNTASELISGTAGLLTYGDGGPQIDFGITETSTQRGSIIFSDHDTVASGASFTFVSTETDWNVISKRFHARTGISVGTTLPTTSSTLYVSGTGNITGNTTIGGTLDVTGVTSLAADLVVGTSTQSTYPTGSIRIHDIRNCSVTPANGDKSVNFYFHQYSIGGSTLWWTIMHMRGWTGSHTSWELAGPANNTDQRTTPLYVRSSNQNSAWGSWRKIYDSSNPPTASEVGALSSSTLYAGSNSAGGPANEVIVTYISDLHDSQPLYPVLIQDSATQLYSMDNTSFWNVTGTTADVGLGGLMLGNAIVSGTDGNARGAIQMYSSNSNYVVLEYQGLTYSSTILFPEKPTGTYTLATTDDIPSTYAGSSSAGGAATNVNITDVAAGGTITFVSSTGSQALNINTNAGPFYSYQGGTTTSVGMSQLTLGNTKNSDVDGNARGSIMLYSEKAAYAFLQYNAGTTSHAPTFYLPGKDGGTHTLAVTSDIPSTYAGSTSAGGAATNVNITNLAGSAAAATYRMTFVSSNGSQALTTDSINGPRYRHEPGTTSAVGVSQIMLGNDTASGSANNAKGMLCLYSENTGRATIEYASTTVNSTFQLPAKTTAGTYTIATSADIPTINTRKIDGVDFNPTGSNDVVRYAVCSTAAATAVKEVTVTGMTQLTTGAMVVVRFSTTNSAAVADLQLKVNSLDAKNIKYRNGNLGDKGYIAANRTYIFIYDGTYWQIMSGDIDTNSNTYDRTSMQTRPYARGVGVFRYSICALDSAQGMESLTTTGDADGSPTTNKAFNTTGKYMYPPVIMYHSKNGAVSAGSVIDNNVLYEQYPSIDLRYSCNVTTSSGFTKYYPLYIECTFDSNGYWSPTSTGLTQTFTSGKYYIMLGCMYNTSIYQLALFAEHPLFYYDGTNLMPISAPTQMAGWIRFNTLASSKILFKDKTNTEYPVICDNGSNIWIGAGQTATNHHIGNTYISAGYDNTNSKGYPTIYVSVPNAANTNATNYAVYHKGNLEGESNALGTQLWIKRADATDAVFVVERTDKQDGDTRMKIMFGIGAGGVNHGIYSSWLGQWLLNGTNNSCEVYHTLQNPSSETRFAISFGGAFENQNVTAGRKGRFVNNGLKYVTREGSTSQLGYGLIELGNNVASGTAGNKLGELRMYGSGQYYAQLYPGTLTDNRLQTLPNVAGRVMITSTNLHGGTDTSGTYPVLTINATLDYITANFTFYMIAFQVDGNSVTQVVPAQTGTYNFNVTYGASSGAMKMVSCYVSLETKDTTTSKITLGYASKMIIISGSSVTTANTPAITAFSFVKFF